MPQQPLHFKTQLLGQRKVCSQFVPGNSSEIRRLERELSKAGCDRVEFYLCCYPEAYGFRPQEKSASLLPATLMHAWRGETLLPNASPELVSAIRALCLPCTPPTGGLKNLPKLCLFGSDSGQLDACHLAVYNMSVGWVSVLTSLIL